ncbi:hypothetical protein F4804DRAFT_219122, partial [Jackrogersella minutella]
MSDSSSIASFEDIGPAGKPFGQGFGSTDEDKNIEKLRALVARSTANGGAARELSEDEVPDVCYVLQYKGWGGKLIDVRRSQEPIDIQLDDMNEEVSASTKKPILEIITKVSTALVQKRQQHDRGPPPRHRRWDPRFDYNDDIAYQMRPTGAEESEMKIAKVERTYM